MIKLSGSLQEFQWKSTEQVWPFEKTLAGKTIYCKAMYISNYSGGSYSTAHNIANYSSTKIIKLEGILSSGNEARPLPFVERNDQSAYNVGMKLDSSNLYLVSTQSYSAPVTVYIWYTKE